MLKSGSLFILLLGDTNKGSGDMDLVAASWGRTIFRKGYEWCHQTYYRDVGDKLSFDIHLITTDMITEAMSEKREMKSVGMLQYKRIQISILSIFREIRWPMFMLILQHSNYNLNATKLIFMGYDSLSRITATAIHEQEFLEYIISEK